MIPYNGEQNPMRPYPPSQNLPQPFQPPGFPVPPGGYGPPLPAYPQYPGLSTKSKTTAGLLQLLLGMFLMVGGVGRLYAGNVGLGLAQLFTGIFAWICFWCGFGLVFLPWAVTAGAWVWFVIDGILLLVNGGKDGEGRPLRG